MTSLISFRYTNSYDETSAYTMADCRVYSYGDTRYLEGYCGRRLYTFLASMVFGDIFLLDEARMMPRGAFLDSRYSGPGSKLDMPDELPGVEPCWWDDIPHEGLAVEADLHVACGGPLLDIHVEQLGRFCEIGGLCRQCGWHLNLPVRLITRCTDAASGQPVTDIYAHLYGMYMEAYSKTPEGRRENAFRLLSHAVKRLGELLPVAYYVGRASGQFKKPKRELLRAAIRRAEPHADIDDAMIDSEINNRVAKLTEQEARAFIDRIAANPRQLAGLYKISRHMVATGKEPNPAELAILEYMAKHIDAEE